MEKESEKPSTYTKSNSKAPWNEAAKTSGAFARVALRSMAG
jgi:hypothetical protein